MKGLVITDKEEAVSNEELQRIMETLSSADMHLITWQLDFINGETIKEADYEKEKEELNGIYDYIFVLKDNNTGRWMIDHFDHTFDCRKG